MATESDLLDIGFSALAVVVTKVDIVHDDPHERGPFCRLSVEEGAPPRPGVYAWVADGTVTYVGESACLLDIVQGQKRQRAYNDYTYVPNSQTRRPSDPRVRVNGLLNRAINNGEQIRWWWMELGSPAAAKDLEVRLRAEWKPPWNRV